MSSYDPDVLKRLDVIQEELININGFLKSIQENLAGVERAIEALSKSALSSQSGCTPRQESTDVRP